MTSFTTLYLLFYNLLFSFNVNNNVFTGTISRIQKCVDVLNLGQLFDLSRRLPKETLAEMTKALVLLRDPRSHFRHGSNHDALRDSNMSLQDLEDFERGSSLW